MHELSLAQGIIEVAQSELKKHQAKKVINIRLKVGELSCVVPETLKTCFQISAQKTPFEKTKLIFKKIPLKIKCQDCKKSFKVDKYCLQCPACKGFNYKIVSGDELQIIDMEVE